MDLSLERIHLLLDKILVKSKRIKDKMESNNVLLCKEESGTASKQNKISRKHHRI